jgi:predicted MFS family arabinose efflux permease
MMWCIGTAVFSMFFFLTQYLQNVKEWNPLRTGVGFLPMAVGIVIAATIVSRLVGRVGIRIPLLIGPTLIVIGLAWLTRLNVTSGYLDLVGPLILIALGLGSSFVPITLTAVAGVDRSETGLASALLSTTQQVGGALGLAVLATIAIDATKSRVQSLAATTHGHASAGATAIATTHGYTSAFEVATCIALAGLVVSITVIRPPKLAAATAPDLPDTEAVVEGIGAL